MKKLNCLIVLASLACSGPALALRIDVNNEAVVTSPSGLRVVERETQPSRVFDFSPFVGHKRKTVRGFSDPLGTGADPSLKVFEGSVRNMDLLGDYHPSNPYDPTELAPSAESLETSQIINEILYGVTIPGRKALVNAQLNLKQNKTSALHPTPRTTETSPLSLVGFGNVSEFTRPVHMHWTHCPDYAFKRFMYKEARKGRRFIPKPGKPKPTRDCFVI